MKKVLLPRSLPELWGRLEDAPDAALYAGGTDLLVKMRAGLVSPSTMICLERIEELKGVHEEDNSIHIGAGATHAQVLNHHAVRQHLPVLAKALKVLGSPLIRNMGTIAGNICTASPAGDALPPLYVLDAQVELRTQHGSRRLSIRDFIISPGKTCLQEKEIVASIRIRKPLEYNVHHYEKVGQRNALACSIAGLAALLQVSPDGIVVRASLAWGSVGPTILTCPEAEEALVGKRLSLENLRKAAAVVREAARPISDVRAEADYRRMVSGNLLLRLMEAARPFLTHGSDRD